METFTYKPKGVCSRKMEFSIENDHIQHVTIVGGCQGNLLGISKIIEGKPLDEIIETFEGVKCGFKKTSCPDQIAQALKQYKETK
ncbi:MAG: TIGR03905 family TSCPD domain-containing protein [Erysipelotrichaceae bacterium]